MSLNTQQFQDVKDLAYRKIQERLRVSPGIKEELIKKFTDWFQGLVAAERITTMQAPAPSVPEGGS